MNNYKTFTADKKKEKKELCQFNKKLRIARQNVIWRQFVF